VKNGLSTQEWFDILDSPETLPRPPETGGIMSGATGTLTQRIELKLTLRLSVRLLGVYQPWAISVALVNVFLSAADRRFARIGGCPDKKQPDRPQPTKQPELSADCLSPCHRVPNDGF
jgi:hypothetical protein